MRKILSLLIFALLAASAAAQELNCRVEVNSDKITGTNKSVFTTLQEAITSYMNDTKFTAAQYSPIEKIECTLFFTIKEYDGDKMTGDIQVQATRPAYNASYTTNLINFRDSKVEFTYSEGEPLTFNETNMESQLTAILNFYAYMIIAIDTDSFAPRGGEAAWDRVKTIVQQAQSSGETGWRAFDDNKNRAAVLGAYTDPSTQQLRDMVYKYHREGIDQMSVSPDKGRAAITESLETLKNIYNVAPMSVGLSMFRDSKLDELVNVYTKGSQEERDRVVEILSSLYPTDQDRIQKIKEGKNK
ncbi:MAG: DUF4835 family protein [Muribaculaceae bacterium]|jgi:hypothetical protein|nr:putative uncharacterized protein [Prevotella sp. CAG:1031]